MSYVRSRSLLYSLEDFAEGAAIAKVYSPEKPYRNRIHSGMARRLYRYSPGVSRAIVRPTQPESLKSDIRLIACQSLAELPLFLSYFQRRGSGQKIACLIEEVWENDIPQLPLEIQLLRQCDVIFVGCHGSVAAISAATDRPAFHLPPAVDTLASNPFTRVPKRRSIDIYYMGRRQPELHGGLKEWSVSGGHFYLFDTAGNATMSSHWEHRRHLSDLIQRSRFFVVSPGKSFGDGERTAPQDEVGARYYEGAAGGAILIGTANRSPILQQNFGYEGAVIPFDGSLAQLLTLINSLGRNDASLETIRRKGVANALRRHDFAHRWKTILQALRQPTPIQLTRRIAQLDQAASEILPMNIN